MKPDGSLTSNYKMEGDSEDGKLMEDEDWKNELLIGPLLRTAVPYNIYKLILILLTLV